MRLPLYHIEYHVIDKHGISTGASDIYVAAANLQTAKHLVCALADDGEAINIDYWTVCSEAMLIQ